MSLLETIFNEGKIQRLNTLVIDNSEIDLTRFQSVISNLGRIGGYSILGGQWSGKLSFGLLLECRELYNKLNFCNEITNLKISNGLGSNLFKNRTEFDLSNCKKLKNIYLGYCNISCILPESCNGYVQNAVRYGNYPDISNSKNIQSMALNITRMNDENWENFWENAKECKELERFSFSTFNDSGFTSLKPLENLPEDNNIKYFELGVYETGFDKLYSLNGIENLKKLEEIKISTSSINDINALSSLLNLKKLTIKNSNISNVSALRDLKNLELINLENNCVDQISAYENLSGNVVSLDSIKMFSNFNVKNGGKLKELYLSGNASIRDFSTVSSLAWNGKSGF